MTIKNSLRFVALMFVLYAAAGFTATEAEYHVTFSAVTPRIAHVEAKVTLGEQSLRMASWGHPYLPLGWATFVHDFHVADESGRAVTVSPAGEDTWGAWKVDAPDGTRLSLSYDVHFDQDQYDWNDAGGQDSRPSLTNGALFLVTKALFIYSPGVESAQVQIDKPDNWIISSPWPAVAGRQDRFQVDSWIGLVNNALVVGEHHQRVVRDGAMTIILAVDSALSESVALFETTFRKQLGAYRKIFNGTPKSQYLVTIRTADEDDGESFENSFNQVITPGRIDQRVIVWASTMGHELFHYWNGNHVLVGKDKSNIEWFGEGFTEYYASLTLFRTGLIDESLYFRKLERYLARNFITTRLWPVDVPSLVEAGKDKHRNWLRIYGGGATIALALDIEVRAATGGDRGLDDVMLALKEKFGVPGARYTVEDILAAVNSVSGRDFTGFFADHITGTGVTLDIAEILGKAGIVVEQFADEFYLTRAEHPTELQRKIFAGLSTM